MSTVAIRTKNKIYRLKYGLNSLIEIEQISKSLDEVLDKLDKGFDLETIRLLFYFGNRFENNTLTFKEAGDIIDEILEEIAIDELCGRIQEAIFLSLGIREQEEVVDSKKA